MQNEPLGLGHAVLCAAKLALPGPVAVILPDDLILGEPGALSEMVQAYQSICSGHLIATMTVPDEEVSKYGVLSITDRKGPIVIADGMVEKPDPADAPSRDAVVGRYILDPVIFEALATQEPGAGGEIQLTDAIARTTADCGLAGFRFTGERFDCGSKSGMLAATLHLAAEDPEYADVLDDFVASRSVASAA
jgi:UTP--glucose-1-phosphate uridylyltransferase